MRKFPVAATLLATLCLIGSTGYAAGPGALSLTPVDRDARLTEDLLAPTNSPLRYAEARALDVTMRRGVASAGTWSDARDAQGAPIRRWSLTVTTPGALSHDFGFASLFLPHGASLALRAANGQVEAGPYTDAQVAAGREFHTALAAGETVTLEIDVPSELERYVSFELVRASPAHRAILGINGGVFAKSGSCNVDVRCPQGTPYPDQINSVAGYTFNGGFACSGALVNNASGNRARYFLTANHCLRTQSAANTMVFYWKYESPTCRAPGSGASGTPIPRGGNSIQQNNGATLKATFGDSDFTLVELVDPVPPAANGFLAGWDRRNQAPTSAFTIHHPEGHEKRITFDNEPLQIRDQTVPGIDGNSFLRVVDYELGTTEGGSSGGPLFSPERRIVGQLAGGSALCSVPDGDDYFGRLFTSFSRGTTAATRLRDWLDPANTGVQTLDGVSLGCTPPAATLTAPAVGRAGEPVTLSLALPAGTFRVEWDVDGDTVIDRTVATASGTQTLQPVYPSESNQTVSVRVTGPDASCATTLQRAIVIDGPRVVASTVGTPQQLCGDGDAAVEPGERWRATVNLRNDGAKAITDGHAVFAPAGTALVRLENPAIALPALAAGGATVGAAVNFAVPTTATCGTTASIRYIGALDRTAWSTNQASIPVNVTLGGGGPCNVIDFCPAQIVAVTPQIGLFVNPNRFGNGFGTVVTDNPDAAPPVWFSAWFTGTTARLPIWYTVQGSLVDNRVDAEVRQFRRVTQSPFIVASDIVGSAQVTYLSATDYLFTFNLNGRTGAERQTVGLPDNAVVRPNRAGAWVYLPESGSGYMVDDARNGGVATETIISFIYGEDNQPRWTFGAKTLVNPSPGPITSDYFEIQCPTCPSLTDFETTRVNAGTLTPTYSSLTTGTLSTNLVSQTPVMLNWLRTNVPIQMISTPRPQ